MHKYMLIEPMSRTDKNGNQQTMPAGSIIGMTVLRARPLIVTGKIKPVLEFAECSRKTTGDGRCWDFAYRVNPATLSLYRQCSNGKWCKSEMGREGI